MHSVYGIQFDSRLEFSLPDDSVGKNVIIFGVDLTPSVHIDNKKNNILIIKKSLTQGLDDTTLTAEAQFQLIFLDQIENFV